MNVSPSPRTSARDLAQIAVFAALIIALGLPGQITIGSSGVPITLQTLGVMLAGALLGARKGVLSVSTVIVLGLALPVLAGGRTTLTSLAGPTAGFLIGWIPAVVVIGWLSARMLPRYRVLPGIAVNVLGGIVVLYVFGIAGMVLRTDLTVWAATAANVAFLPGDLFKASWPLPSQPRYTAPTRPCSCPRSDPLPPPIPHTDRRSHRMSEIRFQQVRHAYGERAVLDDVNVTLTEQRIGIVGANGSGKSTLARMINGLVVPTSGSVTVDGLDTDRKGREVRKRVGFVFTDPDHQIVMPTVSEDVAFSLRRSPLGKAERGERVRQVLDDFGLAAHHDHPSHLLSGGQKQLLALAAIMVTDPQVLVADEPTTLLDLRNTKLIARTFASLEQQLVVVTHHLDLLSDFDRVLVVDSGRIVADDAPDPAIAYYRDLIG